MGDMGDMWNDAKSELKERKKREGIDCPGCKVEQPKRIPTRLLPGWKCRVCGYRYKPGKIEITRKLYQNGK